MSKNTKDIDTVLAGASKLASYNMMLQLSFRVLTFVLNAFVLRYVTKETLGVVNVRLVLLYSTVLFMSREAFRRACLSMETNADDKGKAVKWAQAINLLWCMIPVGFVFNAIAMYSWAYLFENPDPASVPHYRLSVVIFGFCAWIELVVEPLWVIAQAFLFVKLKVISEGIAILIKCIVTVPLVVYCPHWGLLSFCITMVSFSVTYISIYYGYFVWFIKSGRTKKFEDFPIKSIRDLFPRYVNGSSFIDSHLAVLTISFLKQSVLKQLLTEGERYVMTILNVLSFADQGVYDIINNLGSLAARFIFLPIEESFYLFFAKTLKRGEAADQQPPEQIKAISDVLFCLLRLVVLIGSVILAFGLPYSMLLLDLYGGSLLSSGTGPMLLKVYCVYVLAIAINGTTECFVFAAMSQAEVERYNKKMLIFSFLFLTTSYYLTMSVGSVGFILANCLNMLIRIIHSILYIRRFYMKTSMRPPLAGLLPSKVVIFTLIVAASVCSYSEARLCCDGGWVLRFTHIGVGACSLAIVAVVMWLNESELVKFLHQQYFSKFNRSKKSR